MKKNRILIVASLCFILLYSCGGKAKKETNENETLEEANTLEINISETHFSDNWNKDYSVNDAITKSIYDSLKLGNLSFISDYGDLDLYIGNILIDENKKKLLSIKAVSTGEITEYLLSYRNGIVTDSLLVAYEDNVEYFSTTKSVIEGNHIKSITINWEYNNMEEISDTIITFYTITPELRFEERIEATEL